MITWAGACASEVRSGQLARPNGSQAILYKKKRYHYPARDEGHEL